MHRKYFLWLVVLALIVAVPALAGKDKIKKSKSCTASTQECLDKMSTKLQTAGWVGIEYEHIKDSGKYQLTKVIPGSPAEEAGLQAGDILFATYGIEMTEENSKALKKARKDWAPGQKVVYTVKRQGHDLKVKLTLAPMPADVMAQWIGNHMMQHTQVAAMADADS
jgi:predicted metalloprotease with PDZ domain